MRAGDLSHIVDVVAPVGVLSESVETSVASDVPTRIEVLAPPFQPTEGLATGGLRTDTRYALTMRYRTDIRASYVLREQCCTQRTFQIIVVIPSSKRDRLDLNCVTNG